MNHAGSMEGGEGGGEDVVERWDEEGGRGGSEEGGWREEVRGDGRREGGMGGDVFA